MGAKIRVVDFAKKLPKSLKVFCKGRERDFDALSNSNLGILLALGCIVEAGYV